VTTETESVRGLWGLIGKNDSEMRTSEKNTLSLLLLFVYYLLFVDLCLSIFIYGGLLQG
jgi:hypothetical protein